MPIYEYECTTCGTVFEKRQSFNDEPIADCPNGHAETRRLIAAPAIVFKGSGFYINDSKGDKTSLNGVSKDIDSEKKSEKSSEGKTESTAEKKSESSLSGKSTESSSKSSG